MRCSLFSYSQRSQINLFDNDIDTPMIKVKSKEKLEILQLRKSLNESNLEQHLLQVRQVRYDFIENHTFEFPVGKIYFPFLNLYLYL